VTACRTEFRAWLEPPRLIPLSVTHSLSTQTILRAFSVPQIPEASVFFDGHTTQEWAMVDVTTCEKCAATIFLFPDLNDGAG
jgi:hypothetical protein